MLYSKVKPDDIFSCFQIRYSYTVNAFYHHQRYLRFPCSVCVCFFFFCFFFGGEGDYGNFNICLFYPNSLLVHTNNHLYLSSLNTTHASILLTFYLLYFCQLINRNAKRFLEGRIDLSKYTSWNFLLSSFYRYPWIITNAIKRRPPRASPSYRETFVICCYYSKHAWPVIT